jgi:hypothetical protein
MTPSDRGPEIQQRLEKFLDDAGDVTPNELREDLRGEGWDESVVEFFAQAPSDTQFLLHQIQRLTGELAQARRELREQDVEADLLTRELIQLQGELAHIKAALAAPPREDETPGQP